MYYSSRIDGKKYEVKEWGKTELNGSEVSIEFSLGVNYGGQYIRLTGGDYQIKRIDGH